MAGRWPKRLLWSMWILLPFVSLTRQMLGTRALLTLLFFAATPLGVVLNVFYLRLRTASFVALYADAEHAAKARLALAALRLHSSGIALWEFRVLSYGGVLVFALGTYGGRLVTYLGILMIVWGFVPRVRMSVPPVLSDNYISPSRTIRPPHS
jgi:hypothetical protein